MKLESVYKRVGTLSLIIGPITTLAVSPFTNFDPINLVKLLFVTSISFAMMGLVIFGGRKSISRLEKSFWVASTFFIVWMFVSFLMSEAPWQQQVWGVFGRNTGLLTYIALLSVLISTAVVQHARTYHKLVDVLVLTSVPTTLYALVQLAGKDPVAWSEQAPFATLGNINFSSAFFGLAALCISILILDRKSPVWLRATLAILAVTQLAIVLETGSIQGFMIYIAGLGVAIFLWIRSHTKLKILKIPYLILGFVGFMLTVVALFNVGPLARFVFQNTILFRFDYWYAGWMMTLRNPVFGLGMDSYGDWYRQLRGEVATVRTGPDRITNTAHNIYLDISASGGVPLLIAYLVILGFAGRAAVRVLRRRSEFNPYFVALFSAWIAYLIQAGVSINQIGVGIWGWLFTGALIGYEKATRTHQETSSKKIRTGQNSSTPLPAAAALVTIGAFVIGFMLAFVPYRADVAYRTAAGSGDVAALEQSVKRLGATAYHFELVLDAAIKRGNEAEIARLVDELLQKHPRDFMAWRVLQVLGPTSPERRMVAFETLKRLDPYNPSIIPNP